MNWQDKYLCKNINVQFPNIWKLLKKFFILMLHSIFPHESPTNPSETLPEINIDKNNQNTVYNICLNIYNEAEKRINKLEEKSFKMLSYISAIFAFLTFIIINIESKNGKIIIFTSMFFLIVSLLISFRCLNIKSILRTFIDDIYKCP